MNVFCGSTPFLRMENFYKLFDSLGMIYSDRKQIEDWYQRVLENCPQSDKENISVKENYRLEAKQLLNLEDKEVLVIAENNQNAFLLNFWQHEYRNGFFLLLYNEPEFALALALDRGISSQYFIEEWKSSVKQILSFQKRNRTKSILVDANSAIEYPEAFIQLFTKKTNLPHNNIEYSLDFVEAKIPDILLLLSKEILAKDEEIIDLVSELEACGVPIAQNKERIIPTISTLEKEYNRINENVKLFEITNNKLLEAKNNLDCQKKLSKEIEVENDLLLLQLHQVQEELEYYYIEYQKLSGTYETTEKSNLEKKILSEFEKSNCYKKATKKNVKQLFDKSWYKKLAGRHRFSFQHYLTKGWKNKISPHPLFDPVYYLEANQLTESIKCPLVHFVAFGNVLELTPHPLFDTKWYLSQYPDVKESGINPLIHYLKFGVADGRNPSKNFNTNTYLHNYPDVQESELNPLVHYVLYGQEESRVPT